MSLVGQLVPGMKLCETRNQVESKPKANWANLSLSAPHCPFCDRWLQQDVKEKNKKHVRQTRRPHRKAGLNIWTQLASCICAMPSPCFPTAEKGGPSSIGVCCIRPPWRALKLGCTLARCAFQALAEALPFAEEYVSIPPC